MEKEIKAIIERDREPGSSLLDYLRHLSKVQQDEFWAVLKHLALKGNDKQRFISATAIYYKNHESQADLIDELVREISPTSFSALRLPIISIIENLNRLDLIPYCKAVLNTAKERDDREAHLRAFRTLIVLGWQTVFEEMVEIIQGNDEKKMIDTMAYFKFKHRASDWEDFLKALNQPEKLRVIRLMTAIDERLKNHYEFAARK